MYRRTMEYLRMRAVKLGARDARLIAVKTIKTAAWVRYKCQFGCSGFGESLTCPPYALTYDQTQKILDCYSKAILIHRSSNEPVSMTGLAVRLEKEAFLAGYYKAIAFGSGPCALCAECNLGGRCRHAEEARPAMEACGIDVFATVRNNKFTIDTLESEKCAGNYFGLVLLK